MQEPTRLLRRQEVEKRCQLSRATLYRMMCRGEFPEPIKVGARAARRPEFEIEAWLSDRPHATGDLVERRQPMRTSRGPSYGGMHGSCGVVERRESNC